MNDLQKKISQIGVVPVIKLTNPNGMLCPLPMLCALAVCRWQRSPSAPKAQTRPWR